MAERRLTEGDGVELVDNPSLGTLTARAKRSVVAFLADMAAAVTGDRGSARVGHLAPGAGAVPRNLGDLADQRLTAREYGGDTTGAADSSTGVANGLVVNPVLYGVAGLLGFKDVALGHNAAYEGVMSRLKGVAGGTHLVRLNGFHAAVRAIYVSDATALSGAAVHFDTGRGQRLADSYLANCGAGAVKLAPASGSCSVTFLSNVIAEDITGFGLEMLSSVNDSQVDGLYLSGKVDFVSGLGRPRDFGVGWRQNTPVVDGLAVGGHHVNRLTVIGFFEGMHITDGQLTKFGSSTADSCRSYGLIVDGASWALNFEDFFCGSSMGIRVSGSAKVSFDGLTTLLNGVIPPWGQTPFYESGGTVYDLTVQDTAEVIINGDAWRGDKRVYVDLLTAKLTVTGGQWMHFRSAGTVAAGATVWLGMNGVVAAEQDGTQRIERDGWLFFSRASLTVAPGAGKSATFHVRVGGVDQLLDVVAGLATETPAYGYALRVLAGQEAGVQLVVDVGAAVSRYEIAVQFLPD